MARTYNIALYKISIYPLRKPENKFVLSDFLDGKDLKTILYDMLQSLSYIPEESSEETANEVENDTDDVEEENLDETKVDKVEKKYFRIIKKKGEDVLYEKGRCISGVIESGEFGTEENIVNIKSGKTRKKRVNDALLMPFYFMFQIPENSRVAYLLVERISNIGIFSILEKRIMKAIYDAIGVEAEDFVVNISPLVIKRIMEKHVALLGGARKITLERIKSSDLSVSRVTDGEVSDSDIGNTQIVFTAKRNKMLSILNIFNKYKDDRPQIYSVGQVEYANIKFEVMIGGSYHSLSMQDVGKLGTYIEITKDLKYDSTSYPTYESLHRAACNIFDEITKELNQHEDEG